MKTNKYELETSNSKKPLIKFLVQHRKIQVVIDTFFVYHFRLIGKELKTIMNNLRTSH